MRNLWHTLSEDGALTIARHLPPRFDVEAQTRLPMGRKGRLAHQIRQDLWRAFRGQRGFSPVVRVEEDGSHLLVRAGGRIPARACITTHAEALIAQVLEDPKNRARWCANARLKEERNDA